MSRRDAQPALKNAEQRGLGHFPNKHFATQKVFLYRRKHCLLALRTVKLPFQSSRVIFLGRSPAEEHLPVVIQARKCMKKKKHISEEQHYLCEIGLEKMPYGSSWLYKSYTEESLTHIAITAYWLFFSLTLQHGEIYGIAVPRFASWYPPSIWKAIWTFHSEKAENSYSNLGILLLCPTWRKSFRKLPHRLSLHGR